MKITLVDSPKQLIRMLPFTFNKSIADLWLGVSPIKAIYKSILSADVRVMTNEKLQVLYPALHSGLQLFVASHLVPTDEVLEQLKELEEGEEYKFEGNRIAYFGRSFSEKADKSTELKRCELLRFPWDLVKWSASFIKVNAAINEWEGDTGRALSVEGEVHVHEEAEVGACFIDARRGPVIIDEEAVICNGANLVGPVYIGKGAVVLGQAYLRNGVTLADGATANGELKNTVFLEGATKSHDGVIGDSYVGAYANFGAGTTVSNLKNTYGTIKSVDHLSGDLIDTKKQKLGAFIGDYVHTGILSKIQSGASIGFGSHVFAEGFVDKIIPSLRWGDKAYDSELFLEMIKRQAKLKHLDLSEQKLSFIKSLFSDKL